MKVRTLIVDDEPLAREGMADYVGQIDYLNLVGTAKDAIEALPFLDGGTIDLLLLDVNMPKLSGIDLLKNISQPPLTILTTAYPSYALEGYQLSVIDYLVKPIPFPRFLAAVTKAKKQFELLQHGRKPVLNEAKNPDFIFVKCDGRTERIDFDSLLFVVAMQNYVKLHTTRGVFMPLISLKTIEEQLPQPRFFRVHKSYVVQLQKVQSIEGNMLHIDDHRVPISRAKVSDVQELILKGRLLG